MIRRIGLSLVAVLLIAAGPSRADLVDDCYRAGSDPDRSIEVCTRAINAGGVTNARLSSSYNNRGHAKIRKGDFEGAKTDIERALQLNPANAYAYDNLGDMYREWGKHNEALEAYGKAIRVDPKFLSAYFNRGLTYERMGQLRNARADYEALLKIRDPDREIDRWARREAERRLDELDKR